MAINPMLPLRGIQALFAVLVLGLTAYLENLRIEFYDFYNYSEVFQPSQLNFMLFNAIWTILALIYLTLAPRFLPAIAHKFALLAVDAVTMIFWFAGFIALAVIVNSWYVLIESNNPYHVAQATCAFGAFEWLLFVATTVFSAIHVFRGSSSTKRETPMNPGV